jgi:nitroreductase
MYNNWGLASYCLLLIILFCSGTEDIDIHSLIEKRRSIREFKQKEIALIILKQICDDARFAPSPHNLQPWEFLIVRDRELKNKVFGHLEWLGGTPASDKTPVAYIVVLTPKKYSKDWSCQASLGACCQNMLLSAWSYGIGSCWIGSINDEKSLGKILKVPKRLNIFSIIALGYPAEKPVVEESMDNNRPHRDTTGKMRVPKKTLDQILHINHYGSD